MKIGDSQAETLGGCQECQPAAGAPVKGAPASAASVVTADPSRPDWIAIALVTPEGAPVPDEAYVITLADGKEIHGKLDNLGKVRIEGVDPGSCKVTFPERDAKEWRPR